MRKKFKGTKVPIPAKEIARMRHNWKNLHRCLNCGKEFNSMPYFRIHISHCEKTEEEETKNDATVEALR